MTRAWAQLLAFVLAVLVLVAVGLAWVERAHADTQPTWPQVTRVVHPEDLDRCS